MPNILSIKTIKVSQFLFLLQFCYSLEEVLEVHTNREFDPVDLISPLMGTDSEFRLSNGNTYPAIALPWGMNFWTPQTRQMGNGWCYTYDDIKIMGMYQTHQPSP